MCPCVPARVEHTNTRLLLRCSDGKFYRSALIAGSPLFGHHRGTHWDIWWQTLSADCDIKRGSLLVLESGRPLYRDVTAHTSTQTCCCCTVQACSDGKRPFLSFSVPHRIIFFPVIHALTPYSTLRQYTHCVGGLCGYWVCNLRTHRDHSDLQTLKY